MSPETPLPRHRRLDEEPDLFRPAYVKHLFTALPRRAIGADLTDLLPDVWAKNTP